METVRQGSDGVFFSSGKQVAIRLITPRRMSYAESYVKAFLFDKMVNGLLDQGMVIQSGFWMRP